jgi:hypothetical protein
VFIAAIFQVIGRLSVLVSLPDLDLPLSWPHIDYRTITQNNLLLPILIIVLVFTMRMSIIHFLVVIEMQVTGATSTLFANRLRITSQIAPLLVQQMLLFISLLAFLQLLGLLFLLLDTFLPIYFIINQLQVYPALILNGHVEAAAQSVNGHRTQHLTRILLLLNTLLDPFQPIINAHSDTGEHFLLSNLHGLGVTLAMPGMTLIVCGFLFFERNQRHNKRTSERAREN